MRSISRTISLALAAALGAAPGAAQARTDYQQGMLRHTMLGLLPGAAAIPDSEARQHCLPFPVDPPNDRLQGPHGGSLLTARCEVAAYRRLGPESPAGWITAQYRWWSLFTAEDSARGPTARDTVTEEEAVVLTVAQPGQVRPVWHDRYETGGYAVLRSVTPELAAASDGTILLSVESCLNGTGGCGQEFLLRYPDGRWVPVWQAWLDQLPRGFTGRIRHGVRIDPRTLRGEAGFYGDRDANCCPSELLRVQLGVRGDSLVLQGHTVVPEPQP